MGRQDVEDHFVGNGFFDLAADMLTVGSESLVSFSADHLDDAALDDMGRVTLDQPVYHAGTTDQSDLADGQRQQWVLDAAVQLTAGHELSHRRSCCSSSFWLNRSPLNTLTSVSLAGSA